MSELSEDGSGSTRPLDVGEILAEAGGRTVCDRCGGPARRGSGVIVGFPTPKKYCQSCARDGDEVDAQTRILARLHDDADFMERRLEDFFHRYRDDPDLADLLAAAAFDAHPGERGWLEERFALLWDPQRAEQAIRSLNGAALLDDARHEILRRRSETQQ